MQELADRDLAKAIGSEYRIVRKLGAGGMGTVYEVEDLRRGARVALKTLQSIGGDALYLFKKEFRSLSDLSHTNLVRLYELASTGDQWFFTMELVNGRSFRAWVCDTEAEVPTSDVEAQSLVRTVDPTATSTAFTELTPPPDGEDFLAQGVGRKLCEPADPERIREALVQLVTGLHALHESGHLHRDIKPSNILVEEGGRLVILDFGVITELGSAKTLGEQRVVGTPAYMAPEQATLECAPTPAGDWYAVGVILYEALTGYRPFPGDSYAMLFARCHHPPVHPSSLSSSVSSELADLCMDLMARKPEARPPGREILRRLGKPTRVSSHPAPRHSLVSDLPPVGREVELEALRNAWQEAVKGNARAVLVGGKSGMGKSTIISHFLEEAARDGTILQGRCYERETVPYKALDSLVDSLTDRLRELSDDELEQVLPDDLGALGRTFPVLLQLPKVEAVLKAHPELMSARPDELQRRAFAALRSLFSRLAELGPLVCYIDDLQWGDAGSAPFLADWLEPRQSKMLFVASYRTEIRDTSPLLKALLGNASGSSCAEELLLEALPAESLMAIAERSFAALDADPELAAKIAEESAGSPYFVQELVRYASSVGSLGAQSMSLDKVILARAEVLSDSAKRMLAVIATGGMQMPWGLVEHAAGITADPNALVELRSQHFVKATGMSASDRVEPYHDRVREAFVASLGDGERDVHLRIAQGIDALGDPDGEDLFRAARHWAAARSEEHLERIRELNLRAGVRAAESFAYEQAYEFLDEACSISKELGVEPSSDFAQLFGDMCVKVGRVEQGVEWIRRALGNATSKRQRAELHLSIGRVYLGQLRSTSALEEAIHGFTELNIKTPTRSLLSVLKTLMLWVAGAIVSKLQLRATGERERAKLRVEAGLYTHFGYTCYFLMRPIEQLQSLLRMLVSVARLGTPRDLGEWRSLAATIASLLGKERLALRVNAKAQELAEVSQDPVMTARVHQFTGHILHFLGRPQEAEAQMARTLEQSGPWLENADYLTALADLAWNLMMRGKPRLAWEHIERGLRRVALDGGTSKLAKGHTYRCYAGPALAILGEVEEGRRHLSEFRDELGDEVDDNWRVAQWAAHWTLFHAEINQSGPQVEDAIKRFESLKLPAKRLPLQIRHFYIARARLRLRGLAENPSKEAEAQFNAAMRDLRAASKHPTVRAHLHIIEVEHAIVSQRLSIADELLMKAQTLAEETENLWVKWDTLRLRAQLAELRGQPADELWQKADAMAREHGWKSRIRTEAQ